MEDINQQEEVKEQQEHETPEMRLAQCEKEKNEFIDLSRRLKADFANARKEQEREMARMVQFANEGLLLKLLPIIDSFNLAIKHIPKDIEGHSFIAGIKSVKQQMDGILKQVGVTEITTTDTPFDVRSHEAVTQVESEGPEDEIAQELQKGYAFRDKILRPAKVSLTKKKEQ